MQVENFADPMLYSNAFYEVLTFLPVFMFSVYFPIYFILPNYLAKRNISLLVLSAVLSVMVTVSAVYIISKIIHPQWHELDVITLTIRKVEEAQMIVAGSAIIIKIMKDYFLKQRESEMLAVENIRNNLQLLKTQMHPGILFECLHNIYNDIDAGTLYAPEMVLKLSELLSYLLYETESDQVPLNKEVKMIQTYAELKKLEYKNKADIYIEISGDMNDYYIMPGLFLPLLETGFVHFEEMENVSIELKMVASKFYFTLKNNSQGNKIRKMPATNTTLDNIRKRLQIFDVHKFKLETYSTMYGLAIVLQLELEKIIRPQNQTIQREESMIYEHA
ncbi:MAG TPA: histidine kinase [Parafilimonas sp.]|nr:histidine kinase [Parafilimonas sp.]